MRRTYQDLGQEPVVIVGAIEPGDRYARVQYALADPDFALTWTERTENLEALPEPAQETLGRMTPAERRESIKRFRAQF